MANEKTATYTEEQTAQVLAAYAAGQSVQEIATAVGRSARSVIAKLVREGVYKTPEQPEKRLKKSELVGNIATKLELDPAMLASLEKATHEALVALASKVCEPAEI